MPADARDSKSPSNLRHKALDRLSKGSAPPMRGWGIGIEALTLLYTLASTPGSAVDAHKLLHELQVHQVELDLQHEEMELSRGELASNLQLHVELFDLAPVAYLGVDLDGILIHAPFHTVQGEPTSASLSVTQGELLERGGPAIISFVPGHSYR